MNHKLSVRIPDPLVPPLADSPQLIEFLAHAQGTTLEDAYNRLLEEEQSPGMRVCREVEEAGIPPHQWTDELIEFYSTTKSYLYDSLVWNRNPEKLRLRQWIAEYLSDLTDAPLKILCFGDGLGFESLYFNLAGHDAEYYEVSGAGEIFARSIHEFNNVPFRGYSSSVEIPADTYDAVICLDVLEHVPDPPAIIEQFDKFLKDDGRLIISAPFFLVNSQFPTHLDSNRKYSGNFHDLYGRLGYKMHEGCLFWNPIVAGKPNAKRRENSKAFWGKRAARAGRIILRGARYTTVPYTWGDRLFKMGRKNPWIEQLQKIDPKSLAYPSSDRDDSPTHTD